MYICLIKKRICTILVTTEGTKMKHSGYIEGNVLKGLENCQLPSNAFSKTFDQNFETAVLLKIVQS